MIQQQRRKRVSRRAVRFVVGLYAVCRGLRVHSGAAVPAGHAQRLGHDPHDGPGKKQATGGAGRRETETGSWRSNGSTDSSERIQPSGQTCPLQTAPGEQRSARCFFFCCRGRLERRPDASDQRRRCCSCNAIAMARCFHVSIFERWPSPFSTPPALRLVAVHVSRASRACAWLAR